MLPVPVGVFRSAILNQLEEGRGEAVEPVELNRDAGAVVVLRIDAAEAVEPTEPNSDVGAVDGLVVDAVGAVETTVLAKEFGVSDLPVIVPSGLSGERKRARLTPVDWPKVGVLTLESFGATIVLFGHMAGSLES